MGDGRHRLQGTLGPIASPSVLGNAEGLHGVGFWFAVRSTETVLPVELTRFAAQVDGEAVLLTWHTAAETNNAGFEVEHHPPARSSWRSLGFVDGAGTTTTPQSYQYRVEDLGLGTHRFRLRQIDADGTFAYSEDVEVSMTLVPPFRVGAVYPNPFAERAVVEVVVRETQPVRAELFDLLGRRVSLIHDGPIAANQTVQLAVDGHSLASGVYLLRLSAPSFTETRPLSVVR